MKLLSFVISRQLCSCYCDKYTGANFTDSPRVANRGAKFEMASCVTFRRGLISQNSLHLPINLRILRSTITQHRLNNSWYYTFTRSELYSDLTEVDITMILLLTQRLVYKTFWESFVNFEQNRNFSHDFYK